MFEIRDQENIQAWRVPDEELARIYWDNRDNPKNAKKYLLNHLLWVDQNDQLFQQAAQIDCLNYEQVLKSKGFKLGYYGISKKGSPIRINVLPQDFNMEEIVSMMKPLSTAYNVQYFERLRNIIFPTIS